MPWMVIACTGTASLAQLVRLDTYNIAERSCLHVANMDPETPKRCLIRMAEVQHEVASDEMNGASTRAHARTPRPDIII